MSKDKLQIARAIDFAARKHAGQRRKGEAAEPYVNHLAEVALLVAEATGGADANLIAAAYLHDTIEDQGVTHGELVAAFGQDIADLVQEVTDDKSLGKAERKRLQVEHARNASSRAKVLKIADKVSNLRAILASPPADWSTDRKLAYFDWATEVVAGCRGANPWIVARFDEAYSRRGELMGGSVREKPGSPSSEVWKRLLSPVYPKGSTPLFSEQRKPRCLTASLLASGLLPSSSPKPSGTFDEGQIEADPDNEPSKGSTTK